MAETKRTPKWLMWMMWFFVPIFGLDLVLTNEGWQRWLGVIVLLSTVGFTIDYFRKRKKDSST